MRSSHARMTIGLAVLSWLAVLPATVLDAQPLSVSPLSRPASRSFYLTNYQNAAAPAHGWTGDRATCNAGATSAAFRDSVRLRLNYFRAMAGVPAGVAFSDVYNGKAQQAALMMSVNNQLNHNPPTSWTCYSAAGAEAASKSDLFLGMYGPEAISGYIRDPGSGNGAAGHRRWILYPQTQTMGTGDIPPTGGAAANDLWVFDDHMWEPRPETREAFVAWPPPGFVPYQVVYPRWSFSHADADFSAASVTMTQGGLPVPVRQEAVATGYGENTLVWAIVGMTDWAAWPTPASDTTYRVTIGNVVVEGTIRSFAYDVTVMNPSQVVAQPVADHTGDWRSDLLWRHGTRGDVWLWPMNGASSTAQQYVGLVAEPGWEIRGTGDYTGDGKADILWRNSLTGMIYLWTMNGSTVAAETYVATVDPAYDIVSTGDYDGDGKADLLWRQPTNGEVWLWLMDGATPLSQTYIDTVDPGYVVQGSGDLNGDGKADLVWRHATGGDVWVWLMNGAAPTTVSYVDTVGELDYRIAGVADHTGDGKADILWHHATRGEVWLWPMNGASRLSQTYIDRVPDTGYRVVATGDYNGDGKADLLWHHATRGEVWVWLMNGAAKLSETYVATVPDVGYRVMGR